MSDKPIVKLKYRNKEYEVPAGMTVRDAVKKVGLQPETILAVLDKKLLTDDTILREGMDVKLIAVISGGAPTLALLRPRTLSGAQRSRRARTGEGEK